MSRRQSRNSLGERQSNTLEEFENFKKKYLLVNKHIAKLNSSLNVRIEELLSQIAGLNNENLRLKASEISLTRRLANEQDRTRRLYREAESASRLLMDQIMSMKTQFCLEKPANPVTLKAVVVTRPKPQRPSQSSVNRLARTPEIDVISETAEEELSPSRYAAKDYISPISPSNNTPVRRRSTGSNYTPKSTPASNISVTPDDVTQRKSDERRKSTPPISMEIVNSSSPLSPSPSFSSAPVQVSASPSPVVPTSKSTSFTSPPTVDTPEPKVDQKKTRNDELPTVGDIPHLNLTGMRIRRPSGLIIGLDSKPPAVAVSIPRERSTSSIPSTVAATTSYPTPLSATSAPLDVATRSPASAPIPRTPPRQPAVLLEAEGNEDVDVAITPSRKLPMSPMLTANPALSPPPARKLSFARRQLDFGIPDSDSENELEEKDEEKETLEEKDFNARVAKRKALEDDDDEELFASLAANAKLQNKKVEKRRDTGNVLSMLGLKEKNSKGSLVAEAMGSKESLRDVTNERAPTTPRGSLEKEKEAKPAVVVNELSTTENKAERRSHISEGIAARLEKLKKGSQAEAPRMSIVPLPSGKQIESPEVEEEIEMSAKNADIGRRGSGRQRKSVNYKEPSLITKMRKPESTPGPPTSASTSARTSSASEASTATHRPPKRKKGSISLGDDINAITAGVSGTTLNGTTTHLTASKTSTESERARRLADKLLNNQSKRGTREAEWELSSDEDFSEVEMPSNVVPVVSRGSSILSKGTNPIVATTGAGSLFPSLDSFEPVFGPTKARG